jgi:hypothetical protein
VQRISLLSFLLLIIVFVGCNRTALRSSPSGIGSNSTASSFYNKSNLEYLTLGRNGIEVEELMGQPEGRTLGQKSDYLWDYRRPVRDEETGEIFDWSLITFHFSQGTCSSIDITLANPPPQLLEEENTYTKDNGLIRLP